MTTQGFEFGVAAVFLFLAVVGGGVSVKEISVPKIPRAARGALAVLGIGAAVLAIATTPADPREQGKGQDAALAVAPAPAAGPPPCRHPVVVPPVADGSRTEDDVRRLLSDAGLFTIVSAPRFDPNAPHGIVVGITPIPGSVLCPRDPVTIAVTHEDRRRPRILQADRVIVDAVGPTPREGRAAGVPPSSPPAARAWTSVSRAARRPGSRGRGGPRR